jgi:hypothetical protein
MISANKTAESTKIPKKGLAKNPSKLCLLKLQIDDIAKNELHYNVTKKMLQSKSVLHTSHICG